MDFYAFYTGQEFEAYTYLGAHRQEKGVVFRTFAPMHLEFQLQGTLSMAGNADEKSI